MTQYEGDDLWHFINSQADEMKFKVQTNGLTLSVGRDDLLSQVSEANAGGADVAFRVDFEDDCIVLYGPVPESGDDVPW